MQSAHQAKAFRINSTVIKVVQLDITRFINHKSKHYFVLMHALQIYTSYSVKKKSNAPAFVMETIPSKTEGNAFQNAIMDLC